MSIDVKPRPLGELIEVASGQVDPREHPYATMPHIGGDNIESHTGRLSGIQTAAELNLKSGKYLFDDSYILYSKIRPALNKVATPEFDGICSADIYPLRPINGEIDKRFLVYTLRSKQFLAYTEKHSTRTNIPKINRPTLLAFTVPLPPLSEQKRIADILDKADAIRRKREEVCNAVQVLSPSLFQEMFTLKAGLLVGKHIERVDTKKGKQLLADGWRHTTLGAEIILQRGIDITKKDHRSGSVPIVSSGGISGYHDTAHTDGPGVILGRKGSVGSVHFVDEPYWPHDTTLWVREFKSNDARFVYEFFCQFPIRQYEASSANPSLNRNNLHPVCVWWPPGHLQQQFAQAARHIEKSATPRTETGVLHADNLFNSLVQRAFKGEL